MNLRQSLFNGRDTKHALQQISAVLSGTPTEELPLYESSYMAAWLQQYWVDVYSAVPDGPPKHDDLHQSAFADWIEMFDRRHWRGCEYEKVQVLGYYCSEVENTVPAEWLTEKAGWEECLRSSDWTLQVSYAEDGCLYRVCMYAEGGFDLQFWFYCWWDDTTL